MENYTKYRLKDDNELVPLIADKDGLFILACNKCFKEFTGDDEPECGVFLELAKAQGKTVTACLNVDFMCNKRHTSKMLENGQPTDSKNIFVISCGLGVQTVADLSKLPVYAACDSIYFEGRHGMALTKHCCEACGQCYLNFTAGICPIVDCSKSLVNGQCGGSKNGKCEVDKDKSCVWADIYQRLEAQGRLSILSAGPVQLRDYSKINFKLINDHVKAIREKRLDGYYGGLHPSGFKEYSEHLPIEAFPAPKTVVIPLSQHAGAPANPLVKKGDTVKTGQKIGEAAGYISAAVHASISGIVTAVEPRKHPNTSLGVLSVIIESDGRDELHESVAPYGNIENLSADDIVAIVAEKGIVGMGGAGFPTPVKLKSPKHIDTVLLNGCECEPLLTADHRLMLEYADNVVFGLKALLKATGAANGIIVVEDNKPGAAELLEAKTSDIESISVLSVKTKYPQGAEKMLIKTALGRQVPSGGLPLDVGVVVCNVATAKAVSDALQKGLPLIERVVTVTGIKVRNPGNYIVKIGTSVKDICNYCGVESEDASYKLGGPMMGVGIDDLDVPVIKGTNGIIAIEPVVSEPSPCIMCGRCVDVCPMELLPLYYPLYALNSDWTGMKEKAVGDCIECGCCDYICSSKIAIRETIKLGKKAVIDMERQGN